MLARLTAAATPPTTGSRRKTVGAPAAPGEALGEDRAGAVDVDAEVERECAAPQLAGDLQPGNALAWQPPDSASPHQPQPRVALHASQSSTDGHHAAAQSACTSPPGPAARQPPPAVALQSDGEEGPAGGPVQHQLEARAGAPPESSHQPQA